MTTKTKSRTEYDCTACAQDLRLPPDAYDRLALAEQICEQVATLVSQGKLPQGGVWRRLKDYVGEWDKMV